MQPSEGNPVDLLSPHERLGQYVKKLIPRGGFGAAPGYYRPAEEFRVTRGSEYATVDP
jgi:hypothetical protein